MAGATETVVRRVSLMPQVDRRMQEWWRPLAWMRRHGIALAIVLLACAIGQAVTLMQTSHIVVDHDGPSYLLVAHAVLRPDAASH